MWDSEFWCLDIKVQKVSDRNEIGVKLVIMKKLLFIFNPISGKAKLRNKLFEIIEFYTSHGYLATLYPTQKSGDGRNLLVQLDETFDLIVCCGGDGTLNEIVSGVLVSGNKTTIGYIPAGSTNDFSRSIGVPFSVEDALEITCSGIPYNIDVCRFNNHYFIYVAGFGTLANVSYTTPQKMKNTLGYLAYVLEGIKSLSELQSYFLTIKYDGEIVNGEFIIGLITNSFSVAGFKNPNSAMTTLNDGLFEVLLIRTPQNILELQSIITALVSERFESKHILCFQASHIEIESEPMEWTFDGEYGGKYEKADVNIVEKAIKLLVPSK